MAETPVIIGLGGNLGGELAVVARLRAAAAALARWPEVASFTGSAVYRSAPLGLAETGELPAFVNAAVLLRWRAEAAAIDAVALLARLLALESTLGRVRSVGTTAPGRPSAVRWMSRAIDLDLWMIGERVIVEEGPPSVVVPHPRIAERAFALIPLSELIGVGAVLPGSGWTVSSLLAAPAVRSQAIARLPYTLFA